MRLLASTDIALRVLILLGREADGQHLNSAHGWIGAGAPGLN